MLAAVEFCRQGSADRPHIVSCNFVKGVVFLSDALSVLQAYQNHKLPNLAKFGSAGLEDENPSTGVRR